MNKIEAENIEILITDAVDHEEPYFGVRRISASGIGSDCDALLALSLRSFPSSPLNGQQRRRMDLGKHLETKVLDDMRRAGITVFDVDPLTGRQYLLEGFHKHLKAYADGYVMWDDEIPLEPIEIKSMASKRFNAVKKKGLQEAEPKYFDQVITVMGLANAKSLLYVAINKDSSEYLVLRVPFDEERWSFLKARVERVLAGSAVRARRFMCRMCPKEGACMRGDIPPTSEIRCHHCAFASPDVDGKWWCEKKEDFAVGICEAFKLFEPTG